MNVNNVNNIKTQEYYSNVQRSFHEKVTAGLGDNENFLTEESVAATLSISALGADELEKERQSWQNYHVSYLYRTDLPAAKNSEGMYKVGGVSFSEEEFHAAQNLINGVGSELKKGYLSYRDYAGMELAENIVDKCASSVFSEEQVKVINKAMQDYNENIIRRQNESLSNRKTSEDHDGDAGKYFGTRIVLSEEEQDVLSGAMNKPVSVTTSGTDIATNQEKIDAVRSIMKAVDVTDRDAVDKIRNLYREAMKPVYMSQYPFQNEKNVSGAINSDMSNFVNMIDFAKQWLAR